MKIAIFHELHRGGARKVVNEIAGRLKDKVIVDLYVVDERKDYTEQKYFSNSFYYIFRTKFWEGNDWKSKLYKDTIELLKLYFLHKKIAKIIDKGKYDIVFVHPSKLTQSPFILRFLTTKSIYYCQEPFRIMYESELGTVDKGNKVKYLYEVFIRKLKKHIDVNNISKASAILANSEFTGANIKKAYGLISKVCYLGVDDKFYTNKKLVKKYDVLFIGEKDHVNGFDLLVDSLRYAKKNYKIKNQFTLKKWLADKEIRDLYLESRVVVCLARNEPFGLIPLEAMSSGTPVVALGGGGYKETIVNGKTGFLIADNPKELADKLNLLLESSSLREKIGSNARDYIVKNWSWDIRIKDFEKELGINI